MRSKYLDDIPDRVCAILYGRPVGIPDCPDVTPTLCPILSISLLTWDGRMPLFMSLSCTLLHNDALVRCKSQRFTISMSLLFSFEELNTAYSPENELINAKIPPTAVTFPSPRIMPYSNNTAVIPIDIATSAFIRRPISLYERILFVWQIADKLVVV